MGGGERFTEGVVVVEELTAERAARDGVIIESSGAPPEDGGGR